MNYTTSDILDILWEHEVRKQVGFDMTQNTATVPFNLKMEVSNAFFKWYKVTTGQWESDVVHEGEYVIPKFDK